MATNDRDRRRSFIRQVGTVALASVLPACAGRPSTATRAHVVVVGGGFGGATAARYLRLWSESALVERRVGRRDAGRGEPRVRLVSAVESGACWWAEAGWFELFLRRPATTRRARRARHG